MGTDEELLGAWRGGDEAAGSKLLRRHFASLFRFFRPRAGEATADLIQRTMLAAVEARERLPGERFRPFLLGIARHQLLMHQRKAVRFGRAMERVSQPRPVSSPSGIVSDMEQQRGLLRALRRLDTDDQFVLELFYWEELSMKEIAAVLEIPAATVKTRLHRARLRLKEAFDTLGPEQDSSVELVEKWARESRRLVVPGADESD